MNQRERNSLDRHITGNYGEDQFDEEPTMLTELRAQLESAEQHRAHDDYPGQTDEVRRHLIVQAAVQAVGSIISEGSDGSSEERDYLTSAVAKSLIESVHGRISSALLTHDLAERFKPKRVKAGETCSNPHCARCEAGIAHEDITP